MRKQSWLVLIFASDIKIKERIQKVNQKGINYIQTYVISMECQISWKNSLNTAEWKNQHLNKTVEDAERLSLGTRVPSEKLMTDEAGKNF
jgi:16S rRNA U1498 N3-methylase RsmE